MKNMILVLMLAVGLQASWKNGNDFVQDAKEWERNFNGSQRTDYVKTMSFSNYTLGVIDSVDGVLFCISSTANGGQIFSIILKYINENPDKWNNAAWNLVYEPLKKTFPCKKKK